MNWTIRQCKKNLRMGPLPTKPGQEDKETPTISEGLFYGVHVPQPAPEEETVFVDKSEALKLVKKFKRARFKSFRTQQEAKDFALYGAETSTSWPIGPQESLSVGEKPSPFRGPKPQDMVKLRKAIESGDFEFVQRTVWENPRYLVSSGDTPAILQEGSRYNALHVAAKSGDATICAYVLTTVSSTEFIRKLYGDYSGEVENIEDRCRVLLDLYLNTPDKGNNDTPLHFATKFGAVRVVQVLVAYAQCNKEAKNKFQQTAKDIICSRMNNADASLKEEIAGYLEEQFFVPVLRSEDDCIPPTVGQPFSPTSPLELRGDVVSPVFEVQAVAGPMPKPQAVAFRKRWKTPPRIPGCPTSPVCHATLNDPDKGWEKVGRVLAHDWKVSWKEYWPFLNAYTDFSTAEGLQLLEEYLKNRFKQASHDSDDEDSSAVTPPSPEKSSPIKSAQTENHLNDEIYPLSPISELCVAFKACMLNSEGKVLTSNQPSAPPPLPPPRSVPPPPHHGVIGDVSHSVKTNNVQNQQYFVSNYLFMDRYCQTFAKRISDSLQRNIDSGSDFFNKEVQQFCSVVSSCISNSRFSSFDFSKLHSRLGYCVAQRIIQSEPHEIIAISDIIQQNISRKSDAEYSSSDEDDISLREISRRRGVTYRTKINRKLVVQAILCISKSILKALEELKSTTKPPLPDTTEQQCEEIWTQKESCQCSWEQVKLERRHFEHNVSVHKKLIFNSDEYEDAKDNIGCNDSVNTGDCCEPSSGEESDESETGSGDFFTPPSSPIGHYSAVNSDDDLGMESPDEGPEVYISGNAPSKLDTAVLEALNNGIIPLVKYPNICRWRHLVLLHSSHERERWQSPYMIKSFNSDSSTPHSYRALYIPRCDSLRKNQFNHNTSLSEGEHRNNIHVPEIHVTMYV